MRRIRGVEPTRRGPFLRIELSGGQNFIEIVPMISPITPITHHRPSHYRLSRRGARLYRGKGARNDQRCTAGSHDFEGAPGSGDAFRQPHAAGPRDTPAGLAPISRQDQRIYGSTNPMPENRPACPCIPRGGGSRRPACHARHRNIRRPAAPVLVRDLQDSLIAAMNPTWIATFLVRTPTGLPRGVA